MRFEQQRYNEPESKKSDQTRNVRSFSPALHHALELVCSLGNEIFPGLTPEKAIIHLSRGAEATIPPKPSDELLTISEVAARLKVTHRSVHNFLKRGQLPRVKIGMSTRIPAVALNEWIRKRSTVNYDPGHQS